MHTNISRVLTALSDLEPRSRDVFPSGAEVLDYLQRYAQTFGLMPRIRFDPPVDHVGRDGDGWLLRHGFDESRFDRVIVASGRFHAPAIPPVPGLDTFTGVAGTSSTYHYRGSKSLQGKRILVAGCAVSALEVATELAQQGAARVVVTQRRQRYVLPKFAAGVPSDHRIFTRYGVLAAEALPAAEIDRQLREIVVEARLRPQPAVPERGDPHARRPRLGAPRRRPAHLPSRPASRPAVRSAGPSSFRLQGPDALPDAATRFARDAAAFGAVTSNDDTERERDYWSLIQAATLT
jgi:cation diffusion facilitator CzcD-associated flavoprotein CzcO